MYTTVQIQKAVSAYFTSEHMLFFGFAEQYRPDFSYYNQSLISNVIIIGDNYLDKIWANFKN